MKEISSIFVINEGILEIKEGEFNNFCINYNRNLIFNHFIKELERGIEVNHSLGGYLNNLKHFLKKEDYEKVERNQDKVNIGYIKQKNIYKEYNININLIRKVIINENIMINNVNTNDNNGFRLSNFLKDISQDYIEKVVRGNLKFDKSKIFGYQNYNVGGYISINHDIEESSSISISKCKCKTFYISYTNFTDNKSPIINISSCEGNLLFQGKKGAVLDICDHIGGINIEDSLFEKVKIEYILEQNNENELKITDSIMGETKIYRPTFKKINIFNNELTGRLKISGDSYEIITHINEINIEENTIKKGIRIGHLKVDSLTFINHKNLPESEINIGQIEVNNFYISNLRNLGLFRLYNINREIGNNEVNCFTIHDSTLRDSEFQNINLKSFKKLRLYDNLIAGLKYTGINWNYELERYKVDINDDIVLEIKKSIIPKIRKNYNEIIDVPVLEQKIKEQIHGTNKTFLINYILKIYKNFIVFIKNFYSQSDEELLKKDINNELSKYECDLLDSYRTLKEISEKNGDNINALVFYAKEMEQYGKYLKEKNKKINNKHKYQNRFIAWYNRVTSDNGLNFIKPILFIILSVEILMIFATFAYYGWTFEITEPNGENFILFFSNIIKGFNVLNGTRDVFPGNNNPLLDIIFLSRTIIVSLMMYQFILASRKFSRKL